jgi:hypothetical protein
MLKAIARKERVITAGRPWRLGSCLITQRTDCRGAIFTVPALEAACLPDYVNQ